MAEDQTTQAQTAASRLDVNEFLRRLGIAVTAGTTSDAQAIDAAMQEGNRAAAQAAAQQLLDRVRATRETLMANGGGEEETASGLDFSLSDADLIFHALTLHDDMMLAIEVDEPTEDTEPFTLTDEVIDKILFDPFGVEVDLARPRLQRIAAAFAGEGGEEAARKEAGGFLASLIAEGQTRLGDLKLEPGNIDRQVDKFMTYLRNVDQDLKDEKALDPQAYYKKRFTTENDRRQDQVVAELHESLREKFGLDFKTAEDRDIFEALKSQVDKIAWSATYDRFSEEVDWVQRMTRSLEEITSRLAARAGGDAKAQKSLAEKIGGQIIDDTLKVKLKDFPRIKAEVKAELKAEMEQASKAAADPSLETGATGPQAAAGGAAPQKTAFQSELDHIAFLLAEGNPDEAHAVADAMAKTLGEFSNATAESILKLAAQNAKKAHDARVAASSPRAATPQLSDFKDELSNISFLLAEGEPGDARAAADDLAATMQGFGGKLEGITGATIMKYVAHEDAKANARRKGVDAESLLSLAVKTDAKVAQACDAVRKAMYEREPGPIKELSAAVAAHVLKKAGETGITAPEMQSAVLARARKEMATETPDFADSNAMSVGGESGAEDSGVNYDLGTVKRVDWESFTKIYNLDPKESEAAAELAREVVRKGVDSGGALSSAKALLARSGKTVKGAKVKNPKHFVGAIADVLTKRADGKRLTKPVRMSEIPDAKG